MSSCSSAMCSCITLHCISLCFTLAEVLTLELLQCLQCLHCCGCNLCVQLTLCVVAICTVHTAVWLQPVECAVRCVVTLLCLVWLQSVWCGVDTAVWCSGELAGGEERRRRPKAVKLLLGLTRLAIKQTKSDVKLRKKGWICGYGQVGWSICL